MSYSTQSPSKGVLKSRWCSQALAPYLIPLMTGKASCSVRMSFWWGLLLHTDGQIKARPRFAWTVCKGTKERKRVSQEGIKEILNETLTHGQCNAGHCAHSSHTKLSVGKRVPPPASTSFRYRKTVTIRTPCARSRLC